jgi:hypothetical protein
MNKFTLFLLEPLLEFANNSIVKIFLVVAFLNLVVIILYNHFVWSELVYLRASGLVITDSLFIKGSQTRSYINYIVDGFSPVWLFVKLGLASTFMFFSAYLFKIAISIKDIFKNNLVSYIFVVFGDLVQIVILLFFIYPTSKSDILHFYPMSILSFIADESEWNRYYFIFSRINLFQLFFVASLFLLFSNQNKLSKVNSILLSFSYVVSYGAILFVWYLFSI